MFSELKVVKIVKKKMA